MIIVISVLTLLIVVCVKKVKTERYQTQSGLAYTTEPVTVVSMDQLQSKNECEFICKI